MPPSGIVDRLAQELGLDPADVRRKNFIRPDDFPWDVGTESAQTPVVYDSGDYGAGLERALELVELPPLAGEATR